MSLYGFWKPRFRPAPSPLPVEDLPSPELVRIALSLEGQRADATARPGDKVVAGQPLGKVDGHAILSPLSGEVTAVTLGPDAFGLADVPTVVMKDTDSTEALPPLDPETATRDELLERLREADIWAGTIVSRSLPALLNVSCGIDLLIVRGVDAEPALCATSRSLKERVEETVRAAAMLARAAGAARCVLAVPPGSYDEVARAAKGMPVEVVSVSAQYPHQRPPLLLRNLRKGKVRDLSVQTALAAWDAVVSGVRMYSVVVTIVDRTKRPVGNVRAVVGTPIRALLAARSVAVHPGDKVVLGGPMNGTAVPTLDVPVGAGVEGIVVIPAQQVREWKNDPCILCGACVAVCPIRLQPHMLGRLAEFSLFDRGRDHGLGHCVECGMCAATCPSRRPLRQWIRLAKVEARRLKQEEQEREKAASGAQDAQTA